MSETRTPQRSDLSSSSRALCESSRHSDSPAVRRAWLAGAGPDGAIRLDVLHRSGGAGELAAELRPEFFTTVVPSTLPTGEELDASEAIEDYRVEHVAGSFSEPVVHTRTVP